MRYLRVIKIIEKDKRMVVTKGEGLSEYKDLFNGYRISVSQGKIVLDDVKGTIMRM